MTFATRIIVTLLLTLTLAVANRAIAQETTTTATTTTVESPAQTVDETPELDATSSSHEVRMKFANLLRQSPSELGTILALDPTLLSNDAYLAGYPELARFVAAHPEVRRNPRFFLGEFQEQRSYSVFDKVFEMISIISVFAVIGFSLMWLVRTVVEQKRWSQLSRIQTEAHNKILDRFGSSAELLEYIKSPSGTKFLESAPIPLYTEGAPSTPPHSRVMWSIQIGVVVVAASIGMLIVSGRFDKETAQSFYAMAVIGLSLGLGFVASAIVSLFLSRRLGLWAAAADDAGRVR